MHALKKPVPFIWYPKRRLMHSCLEKRGSGFKNAHERTRER